MKDKSCLVNPIPFYDKVTYLADEGKSVGVVYLDCSKTFDTILGNWRLVAWMVDASLG